MISQKEEGKGDTINSKISCCGISYEFNKLLDGLNIPCNFLYPRDPPPWLNTTLFDIGIQFYHKNIVGIMASNGEALVMGLALPTFYQPLAFSGVTSGKKKTAIIR